MTAIVKQQQVEAPPVAKAGYVLPGLGHLLTGRLVVGVGMLTIDLVLLFAAFGLFRLPEIVKYDTWGGIPIHPIIAVISFFAMAGAQWFAAHRLVRPRQLTEEEENSNWNLFLRDFSRHDTGMLGFYGVVLMIGVTLLTPLLAPFDPEDVGVGTKLMHPDVWGYLTGAPDALPLGSDVYGRDYLSRLLYGGRISMSIGFVAVGLAASIGTSVGAIAGYFGGWVDRGLMWFVDMLLSLPRLVLLLAIVGMFRVTGVASIFLIVTILGLTGWMGVSRIVRSQVLSLKQQDFIQAARALGYGHTRIVFRHLVPNALAPVIVYCSLAIGGTMLAEAGLSFLGLGVAPPTSTWGTLVSDGREYLRQAGFLTVLPGLCIVMAVMSFNLLGDGLRDAMDPKLRGTK
ncbi:MAG: ABC transporter permease [Deltaproteobacteria bacterium]|nr:MAG: ABC transporter permease [Deltaproteobacteria bacterium]